MIIFDGFKAKYSFEQPPKRLISLVPSYTELLFELGLGDRVVGATDWCIEPEAALKSIPKVGGTKNPSIKLIGELDPDLVLMNQEENRKIDVERLEDRGLSVWLSNPSSVHEAMKLVTDCAEKFQLSDPSVLAQVERLNALKPRVTRKRAACFIWKDPWMAVGSETYISDVIRFCGGENVVETPRYPKLGKDEIQQLAPELVLLPSEPYEFSVKEKEEVLSWGVPEVHLVDGSLLSWHGFRLLTAYEKIGALFENG